MAHIVASQNWRKSHYRPDSEFTVHCFPVRVSRSGLWSWVPGVGFRIEGWGLDLWLRVCSSRGRGILCHL